MTVRVNGSICIEMECASCGVNYAFPQVLYDTAYREGGFWSCPNGHRRGWDKAHGDREETKVRQERDLLKQQEARLRDELGNALAQVQAEKRSAARLAKRAAAGICPCCTRTFTNMARHMKTKHPDFNVIPLMAAKA